MPRNSKAILQAAVRVPDHAGLVPFRFLRIAGEARTAFANVVIAQAPPAQSNLSATTLAKIQALITQTPLILVVITALWRGHAAPELEQHLTTGCVCFAILQAAQAYGYGAQWLTSWAAYDPKIAQALNLADHESVCGFIHIGTPRIPSVERPRPDAELLLRDWKP